MIVSAQCIMGNTGSLNEQAAVSFATSLIGFKAIGRHTTDWLGFKPIERRRFVQGFLRQKNCTLIFFFRFVLLCFFFYLALPSKPRHLKTLAKNQTTVVLSWSHSHHRGGRRDLFYEIECKIACQKEQTSCSQDCGSQVLFLPRQRNLSDTQATITKLFPRTSYRFKVYAKNGVSGVAEEKGFPSYFAHLKVNTLESGKLIN